jgi:hypothetical protein
MNPMDDALLDDLVERSKRKGRKGRKAQWRLDRLTLRRARMAENAFLMTDRRLLSAALNKKWFAGFKKLAPVEDLKIYAPNDAAETFRFYQHYVHSQRPPRAR